MGFKENLRSELDYSGMLVKELAAKSGVKKHSLDRYLDSRRQLPNIETGVKIARALGVSVEYLVANEEVRQKTTHYSTEARKAADIITKMDKKYQKMALSIIKLMEKPEDEVTK